MKTWINQVPELSKHFRVHTYDVRGFGATNNPSNKFSVQQHAYDLYALLTKLKLEKVVLVGVFPIERTHRRRTIGRA
jgi:non-heme chloroperoxidase